MTVICNSPQLRFSDFNDQWSVLKLGNIAKINDGTHQTPKYVENGIKFVSVENIHNLKNTSKFITSEAYEKGFKVKPRIGDILMTRITAGVIGATAIVTDNEPLAYYVSLALIREVSGNHIPYLAQRIESTHFKRELHKRIIHVAFPKKINLGDIGECLISIPSLPEQQKIASFLSKVDEKIALLVKKQDKLTEYKKGVMQQLFNGKWQEQDGQLTFIPPTLRFKADDGSEFPDWTKSTLGDIGKVKMCKRIMANQTSENGDIPFFKIGTFGREPDAFISQELYDEYRHKFSFPNVGDILMSASGTLGRTVVYDGSPAYFQDSNIVWIENDGSFTTNEFLFYVYQIVKYQSEGGTIQRLYNNIIMSAVFDNPSLKEQKKIVKFLSAIDQKIDLANSELEKAKEWKRGLLQQMFV